MTRLQEINHITEQAKNQRAQHVASGFRSYGLPLALIAAISLVLLQFSGDPHPPKAEETQIAQVVRRAS